MSAREPLMDDTTVHPATARERAEVLRLIARITDPGGRDGVTRMLGLER